MTELYTKSIYTYLIFCQYRDHLLITVCTRQSELRSHESKVQLDLSPLPWNHCCKLTLQGVQHDPLILVSEAQLCKSMHCRPEWSPCPHHGIQLKRHLLYILKLPPSPPSSFQHHSIYHSTQKFCTVQLLDSTLQIHCNTSQCSTGTVQSEQINIRSLS